MPQLDVSILIHLVSDAAVVLIRDTTLVCDPPVETRQVVEDAL